MLDDYVMDTTLVATGVSEILELYEYSCKYELTHLCMRYAKELSNRLSTESFLQVCKFQYLHFLIYVLYIRMHVNEKYLSNYGGTLSTPYGFQCIVNVLI